MFLVLKILVRILRNDLVYNMIQFQLLYTVGSEPTFIRSYHPKQEQLILRHNALFLDMGTQNMFNDIIRNEYITSGVSFCVFLFPSA